VLHKFVFAILFLLMFRGPAWSQQQPDATVPQTKPDQTQPTVIDPQIKPEQQPAGTEPQVKPEQPGAVVPETKPQQPQPPKDMVIGSGDLLEISVYGAPDYKYEVRVSSNGSISLPMVGAIHVSGMPTVSAEMAIGKQLNDKGIFNQPQVSVLEKEYATQGISVLGEVQKPGTYPLMGPRKLFDVISAAGGTTPKAGDTATITHRETPNQQETVKLSNNPEAQANNVAVRPGDMIVISKAGIIYVIGDVKDPAGIVMETPHLSVLQAIALAHGTNSTAKLSDSKLIRNTPTGPQAIPVPLNKILTTQSPDIQLKAGDILYVPNSVAKSVTRRTLDAIVQTATGLAIYRP
jgi:polysaccharide biosynthesis/export protein